MELPTWLTTAIGSVSAAVIGWFAGRRLMRANVAEKHAIAVEKEATALDTMSKVAAHLAKQVEAFTDEVPIWKQKVAIETVRAEKAEKMNKDARFIQEQAKIIVEACSELSYMKDPDEPESKVERLFKQAKEAAKNIAEIEIGEG